MKKILVLLFVSTILFLGCTKEEALPSVKGRKNISTDIIEEYLYEWDREDQNKIIRITKIYTYVNPSTKKYEEKTIDCENYKRQGSLYSCKVIQETDRVIYKEIDSRDSSGTKEEIIKLLEDNGYRIVEE